MKTASVLVCAGQSTRMGGQCNKTLLPLHGVPCVLHAASVLRPFSHQMAVVASGEELPKFQALFAQYGFENALFICGGATRQKSVLNGLKALDEDCDFVLVHDGARPFLTSALVEKLLDGAGQYGCAIPSLPVRDSVKRAAQGKVLGAVERNHLFTVQTPQVFDYKKLLYAYETCLTEETDDAGVFAKAGFPVYTVTGELANIKLTYPEDIELMEKWLAPSFRTGTGFDAHRLVPERALVLCGVQIPYEMGLSGHSDADVAVHALMDALLGACALGDIGKLFPDSDPQYKDISSMKLLRKTIAICAQNGFFPHNADITIVAQAPRLAPYMEQMRRNLAEAMGLNVSLVNVKATTTEGMGYEGEKKGISAQAVVLVKSFQNPQPYAIMNTKS